MPNPKEMQMMMQSLQEMQAKIEQMITTLEPYVSEEAPEEEMEDDGYEGGEEAPPPPMPGKGMGKGELGINKKPAAIIIALKKKMGKA